jgi:hypothetical protein
MSIHLYLSLVPESLVASTLPPEQFGNYLAVGTRKRTHGQAIFFELREGFESELFERSYIEERCVPHPDGQPKHSVYLAIYRVLERIPPEAMGSLYLTTAHGRVLEIAPAAEPAQIPGKYHLFQELCPVHPLIASTHDPRDFARFITDESHPISVPRICFVELDLGELADDPAQGSATGLPYPNLDHLRSCLQELAGGKQIKTVDRAQQLALLYRCIRTGFFVADRQSMLYYPYPSLEELESDYYQWWRCANDSEVDMYAMHA